MASLMPDSINNQLMTDEAIASKITAETVSFLCLLPFVTKVLISCWKVIRFFPVWIIFHFKDKSTRVNHPAFTLSNY